MTATTLSAADSPALTLSLLNRKEIFHLALLGQEELAVEID